MTIVIETFLFFKIMITVGKQKKSLRYFEEPTISNKIRYKNSLFSF